MPMCRIGWAPNIANKWQMGFNSAFKGLTFNLLHDDISYVAVKYISQV